MCAMTVPTTCTAIPAKRGFGASVRQNNQNSQNEPGMSFGINEPYFPWSFSYIASRELSRPRSRKTRGTPDGRRATQKSPRLEQAPTVATDACNEEAGGDC